MLRRIGLTLLCLTAVAVPAHANEAMDVSSMVARKEAVTAVVQAATPERAAPVGAQVASGGAAAMRAPSAAGIRGEVVDLSARTATLTPKQGASQRGFALPWLRPGRSGVALPITERLRVGLGYRLVEGEDLWPEFVDTGAVHYQSHHVLLRASWRF